MIDLKKLKDQAIEELFKEFSEMSGGGIQAEELQKRVAPPILEEIFQIAFGELTTEQLLEWINNPKANKSPAGKALIRLAQIAGDIYQAKKN